MLDQNQLQKWEQNANRQSCQGKNKVSGTCLDTVLCKETVTCVTCPRLCARHGCAHNHAMASRSNTDRATHGRETWVKHTKYEGIAPTTRSKGRTAVATGRAQRNPWNVPTANNPAPEGRTDPSRLGTLSMHTGRSSVRPSGANRCGVIGSTGWGKKRCQEPLFSETIVFCNNISAP